MKCDYCGISTIYLNCVNNIDVCNQCIRNQAVKDWARCDRCNKLDKYLKRDSSTLSYQCSFCNPILYSQPSTPQQLPIFNFTSAPIILKPTGTESIKLTNMMNNADAYTDIERLGRDSGLRVITRSFHDTGNYGVEITGNGIQIQVEKTSLHEALNEASTELRKQLFKSPF